MSLTKLHFLLSLTYTLDLVCLRHIFCFPFTVGKDQRIATFVIDKSCIALLVSLTFPHPPPSSPQDDVAVSVRSLSAEGGYRASLMSQCQCIPFEEFASEI